MKKTTLEKWTIKAAATLEKRIDRAENKRGPLEQIRYCNDKELGCLYVNDAGTVLYRIPGQQIPADASPALAPMPGLADLFRRVRDDARQQLAAEVKPGTTGDGKAAVALYGEDGTRLALIDAKLYKEAPAGASAYVSGATLPVLFTDEGGEPLAIVCPRKAAEFTTAEEDAPKPAKKSRLVSIQPQAEPEAAPAAEPEKEAEPEAQPAQEITEEPKAEDNGDTWHDLDGANAAPAGMKWQSNGKSRFSSEYAHRLVKKDPAAEKEEADSRNYYSVSFEYASGIYCANIARAESAEDVKRYYSKYNWASVKEASAGEVETARRKGMPFIDCPKADPAAEMPAEAPETAQEAAEAPQAEEVPAEAEKAEEKPAAASYAVNEEKSGIEISFTGKPSAEVREMLKKSGFRWHNVRRVWYAKATPDRLALAQSLAGSAAPVQTAQKAEPQRQELTAEALEAITAKYSEMVTADGEGMYAGYTGANGRGLYGQDLKKAILAELKKNGFSATARSGRGGYTDSFTFTVKVPEAFTISESDYIKAETEGRATVRSVYWYTTPAGQSIHRDALPYDYEERQPILEETARRIYRDSVANQSGENVAQVFKKAVEAIVTSFNSDHSDSMTDYFDRGIYDWYRWAAV